MSQGVDLGVDQGCVHDVVAVGAGPFNLGLAALASTVDDLDVVVLDAEPELTWHRGLMLDGAELQVSFLADLVTLVAPTHPLSFLAYLADVDRMYPFYVREEFHPARHEYEDYLRWCAARLPSVRFGHRVRRVDWDDADETFTVHTDSGGRPRRLRARHLVVGVGTEPYLPGPLAGLPSERVVHTGDYLHRLDDVDRAERVTVVGSGQSGAEVFLDLLRRRGDAADLSWLTRSESFAPLDYTKLVLEMTTPEYVDYFHALPEERRDALVREQWRHYKGISAGTLDEIHDALYAREVREKAPPVELRHAVAVERAEIGAGRVRLTVAQRDTGATGLHETDLVVAATGYRGRSLDFLDGIADRLHRDDSGRWQVRRDHSVEAESPLQGKVFVANADLHTHGPAAPDLGIGAVRNAGIINAVTGRECYRMPRRTAFATFDAVRSG